MNSTERLTDSHPVATSETLAMTASDPTASIADRVYRTDTLSVGLVLPVHRGDEAIDFGEQIALAELADEPRALRCNMRALVRKERTWISS